MANTLAPLPGVFRGVQVHVVDPGTELICPLTGEKHVVEDGTAIKKAGEMWVTPKMWTLIKERTTQTDGGNGG